MSDVLITGNRLRDGVVVWLDADLVWSADRKDAAHFTPHKLPAALQTADRDNHRNIVTAVYEIKVNDGAYTSSREQIRAIGGPTIVPPRDDPPPTPTKRGHHV